MTHVIYLKLRQKKLLLKAKQIHKMTFILTQNDDFFFQIWPFWVKNNNLPKWYQQLFLSQSEKNHVIYEITANSQQLAQM